MVKKNIMKKTFTKYLTLLAVYLVLSRLLNSFAFKVYYNFAENPDLTPTIMGQIQLIINGIANLFGFIIALVMFVETKNRKYLEWLIFLMTIFYPSIGVAFFLIYRFQMKYEA